MSSDSDTGLHVVETSIEPTENHSYDDASDSSEKLVIETPKKKKCKIEISDTDKKILEVFEQSLEDTLDKKAAKVNFKKSHVKNMLKHVCTNEHVLAFVKHVENPIDKLDMEYEPKLTRAKAKELLILQPPTWKNVSQSVKSPSATHVLINEDLPEDSSGDEYVPVDDESDDEKDHSVFSESESSVGPATPQSADCSTQTNWTEDGVFKIPPIKTTKETDNEETNIALRTRSKLCLSNTPLEDIEEAFVPPDITTDMYDMECDDEEWNNFLKEFTRPLDEVTRCQEDEDHDPEYNVLADEEIDVIDSEELRVDRGVKITRKELNDLIVELVDYADNYNNYFLQGPPTEPIVQEKFDDTRNVTLNDTLGNEISAEIVILDYKHLIVMKDDQKLLLEQQIRQHVQLLTQTFMLSYLHPEVHTDSIKCKSYLAQLKEITLKCSFYNNLNIDNALALVIEWEEKLKCDNPVINDYKRHWTKLISEMKEGLIAGTYIPKFHKLFLETVSNSTVFLYPSLLPHMPYAVSSIANGFSKSENEMISLGLEQFFPFLSSDKYHAKKNGEVKLNDVCFYISKYMMPCRNREKLYKHVSLLRNHKYTNPIRYYFENNAAPMSIHYVIPFDELKDIPPCKHNPNELPNQWREHLFPTSNNNSATTSTVSNNITKVNKPPVYNKKFSKRRKPAGNKSKSAPAVASVTKTTSPYNNFVTRNDIFASTPKCKKSLFKIATPGVKRLDIPESILQIKFNSSIFAKVTEADMLPSMPVFDVEAGSRSEPAAETSADLRSEPSEQAESTNEEIIEVSSSTINTTAIDNPENCTIADSTVEVVEVTEDEKDNLDDINALVVASSTIKSATAASKKRATGLEKKRAKMKRDFADNFRLLKEEDTDVLTEKRNRFIQAFYDKVQETLELEEFHRFMAALNDFDEATSSVSTLYNRVSEIMGNKHPDIMDEFLLFFDSMQAKTIGKLVPYLMMNNMSLFLRKLEIFFQDQPSQVRKIYRSITDLSGRTDVTMAQVKSTVLPLLKGNALLTDWFLQIFPMEKPPGRLLNGAWENICLNKDKDTDKDTYETVILPEIDDPYGGPNCICHCHTLDDVTFKARSRHCTPCGTKFMQGRVFLQTGKGLRPAKITFQDTGIDHKARLSVILKPKRSDASPVKQISPGKDSQDETRQSSDDEPDKKQQRLLKSGKKKKPRKKAIDKSTIAKTHAAVRPAASTSSSSSGARKPSLTCTTESTGETETEPHNVNKIPPKLLVEEPSEWDCNTSIESIEIRMSPEPGPSAESESEFFEELETSQDNNSDSDVSCNDADNVASCSTVQWTREEDKVILETFQKEEVMDVAFKRILTTLKGRSLEQVKQRFEVLINFLKKMSKTR